jgi:hypothetical protein
LDSVEQLDPFGLPPEEGMGNLELGKSHQDHQHSSFNFVIYSAQSQGNFFEFFSETVLHGEKDGKNAQKVWAMVHAGATF